MTPKLTRRQALASGIAAPALLTLPLAAQAAGHAAAPAMPIARGFTLGDFAVTTLLSGSAIREEPQTIFGLNVSADEFAAVSAANHIPIDKAQFYFTPTLVQAGDNTILFDTGLNAAGITKALEAAGVSPDAVTHVVLTHMHGDHIGGMMTEAGTPTFANAAYITGRAEYDHWAAAGNEGFDAKVKPMADKMTFLEDGGTVAPGITAVAAHGHTPGHMNYMLDSGGQRMLLMADLANHYVWSLAYPDWEVRFDMDKAAAAATRRRILSMAAAEKMPVIGYHMPFPAAGFIDTRGDGFHYVPVSYQL